MKTLGIIAEFNPFHTGHAYLIREAMQKCEADRCVIVMSGDFVQRGAPAIVDCHARAEMALGGGASLVLSLNPYISTGSAGYFADGAVRLLDSLGIVDFLAFGSETAECEKLSAIADILSEEPPAYKEALNKALAEGLSFPSAREKALSELCDTAPIKTPNNILAIEYLISLRQCKSNIRPIAVSRTGGSYHDNSLSKRFASASALRNVLLDSDSRNLTDLNDHLSKESLEILKNSTLLDCNDFSRELLYALRMNLENLDEFYDIPAELADRIRNKIDEYKNFDDFCALLKSKERTYTSISRALMHIILGLKTEKCDMKETTKPHYARVLGFRAEHSDILKLIKEKSSIPLITNDAAAKEILNKKALRIFNEEIRSAHIYQSVVSLKSDSLFKNEYRRRTLILK